MLVLADPIIPGTLESLPLKAKVSNFIKIGPTETFRRIRKKVLKKVRIYSSKQGMNKAQDKYHNYVPKEVYPGNAIIIKTIGGISLSKRFDPATVWGKLIAGELDIHEISSRHTELFDEPTVNIDVADFIDDYLTYAGREK